MRPSRPGSGAIAATVVLLARWWVIGVATPFVRGYISRVLVRGRGGYLEHSESWTSRVLPFSFIRSETTLILCPYTFCANEAGFCHVICRIVGELSALLTVLL